MTAGCLDPYLSLPDGKESKLGVVSQDQSRQSEPDPSPVGVQDRPESEISSGVPRRQWFEREESSRLPIDIDSGDEGLKYTKKGEYPPEDAKEAQSPRSAGRAGRQHVSHQSEKTPDPEMVGWGVGYRELTLC